MTVLEAAQATLILAIASLVICIVLISMYTLKFTTMRVATRLLAEYSWKTYFYTLQDKFVSSGSDIWDGQYNTINELNRIIRRLDGAGPFETMRLRRELMKLMHPIFGEDTYDR